MQSHAHCCETTRGRERGGNVLPPLLLTRWSRPMQKELSRQTVY